MLRILQFWLAAVSVSVCSLAAPPLDSITITDLTGEAQRARPLTISRVFAQGEIPDLAQAKAGSALLSTQCDVKTRWPDGSVQHAILSFRLDLPSRGAGTVEFVNQPAGSDGGFLTKKDILDPLAPWAPNLGAEIAAMQGTTQLADLLRMLTEWDGEDTGINGLGVRYWLKGPIVTQLIVEDRDPASSRYDFGWNCSTGDFPCAGSWSLSTQELQKSLHPIFVLTIYPGHPAVKIEMILENTWVTRLKDQNYSLELRLGNPLTAVPTYSRRSFNHYARTRWRKVFWSGATPGNVKIDHNLAYLIYSRAIPSYDLTKRVDAAAVESEYSEFRSTDRGDLNGSAQWQKYFPTTGGRPDIGLYPRWYVRYLYTFDPKMLEVLEGDAAASGHVPIHLRESDASKKFDDIGSVSAGGRVVSLDARPRDLPAPLVPLSQTHGWVADQAHQPDLVFIPYITQGDWYYLEELWFWSAYNLRAGTPGTCYYCRHDDWGYFPLPAQTRGKAWAMRTLIDGVFTSPDRSPEKAQFLQKLQYNIAVEEGKLGITNGAFYDPSPASPWSWGRNVVASQAGATVPYGGPDNPLGFFNYDSACVAPNGQDLDFANLVRYCDAPWMYHFVQIVWSHGLEMGFPFEGLLRMVMKILIHEVLDPNYNPWLVGAYHFPVIRKSDHKWFSSWKEMFEAWSPTYRNATSWDQIAPGSDDSNVDSGYPHIARAASSFSALYSDGSLSGENAWHWLNGNVGHQGSLNQNPKWAFVPRSGWAPKSVAAPLFQGFALPSRARTAP